MSFSGAKSCVRRDVQGSAVPTAEAAATLGVRTATTSSLAGKEGLKITAVLYEGGEPARNEPR